ncbi:MAG: asparagine synthetase B family protein [Dehalococcoidia bacterium]|jgi:asparagine synthetase B (glutamine-hydrolysing)
MFLLAVTNSAIAQNIGTNAKELRFDAFIVTIATDNFLSKSYSDSSGFSITESLPKNKNDDRDINFLEISYKKEDSILEVYKPVISGRPIYYHINTRGEFFCSTHISMLRKAGVAIEENKEVLPEFFVYRYVMPPVTLYRNIFRMAAGRMHIKFEDGKCLIKSVDPYIPVKKKIQVNSLAHVEEQVNNYLYQAIDILNTRGDMLAVLLSGGLDSSILLRMCQNRYGVDTSYSVSYPFEDEDKNIEKKYALSAAEALGTSHNLFETTMKDYLRGFLHSASAAEEPLPHVSAVMLYLFFKEAIPQSNIIVVSGEGGDGIWGVYLCNMIYESMKWPYRLLSTYPVLPLLKFGSHISGRYVIGAQHHSHMYEIRTRTTKYSVENPDHIIWSMGLDGDEHWVYEYFGVTKCDVIKNRLNAIKPYLDRSIYDVISLLAFLGEVSNTELSWSKLGESQHRILYYPYNQLDLLDYANSVPWDMKLKEFKNIGRGVARQLQIPEFIITRPKSGFEIRSMGWAERGGVFEPLVRLSSKVFDEEQIRAMQSTDPKKALTLWNILTYCIWKRLCVDNEPLEALLEELLG